MVTRGDGFPLGLSRESGNPVTLAEMGMDPRLRGDDASLRGDDHAFRFCVAPMLDWTDSHCRVFHRHLAPQARLYTEMITTGALLHGPRERLLRFDDVEHPVALQLGGSEPEELAICAAMAEDAGYDEINLNCGCPSPRVQRGAFGACLMQEPERVADAVLAMRSKVKLPVTVKHRLGVGRNISIDELYRFVTAIAQAGCQHIIVHARTAVLEGLSPKDNREIPPLRYDLAYQLKRDFPALTVVINGGIQGLDEIDRHLQQVDGVMIGRAAYQNPWLLRQWAVHTGVLPAEQGDAGGLDARAQILLAMLPYAQEQVDQHQQPLRAVVKSWLGLMNGLPGARQYRRVLSDSNKVGHVQASDVEKVLQEALSALVSPA